MRDNDDSVFNILISSGWANETTGHVDSPTGHVALVDLTTERDMMTDIITEDDPDLTLPLSDWYVVITDSNGNIWPRQHVNEGAARRDYDRLDAEYAAWDDDGDDFPTI